MRGTAFSPGHVTGFVQFPTLQNDPLLYGSLGAGFCTSKGVKTTANVESAGRNSYSIMINGKLTDEAEVSRYVVDEYLSLLNKNYKISVEHELEIPIGYGLGSSGAAALSLSLALNQALGRPLRNVKAAQIAHKADLACRCGVGTVIAEFNGGFEMRLAAGAPGIGVVEKIPLHDKKKAVILCIAPVSTKDFLTNKIQLINGLGGKMLSKLSNTRSVDNFMQMSLEFARSIGFMNKKCKEVVDDLLANGYASSTAMFGETVFSIVKDDAVDNVNKILSKYDGSILVCAIDNNGARVC